MVASQEGGIMVSKPIPAQQARASMTGSSAHVAKAQPLNPEPRHLSSYKKFPPELSDSNFGFAGTAGVCLRMAPQRQPGFVSNFGFR
jgi:hypothetical protein